MDKELKDKWIAALRSGEYKQIQRRLKSSEGFCCLGVLCEIVGKDQNYIEVRSLLGSAGEPERGIVERLFRMNDGDTKVDGKSFPEIADYIEANL